MAPFSDRDQNTRNESEPKSDNPFIKFRQFADSQISSLLQGIVGLPSAFSKSPNNTRWVDFDEDMRRRDELQKRQNELRDSEAKRQDERQGCRSWEPSTDTHVDDEEMDERTARDLPLYSPVSRHLFAHLRAAKNDHSSKDDWTPIGQSPLPFAIFPDFLGFVEPIKALRTSIYRDVQQSPFLRSDYSLLPYLLFSPYSPLKLASDSTMQSAQKAREDVPYCDAFKDLILTTQGRPMENSSGIFSGVEPGRAWIYKLWAHGILQQRTTTTHPAVGIFQRKLAGELPWVADVSLASNMKHETELDMYERFLRRASTSSGLEDVLESLFMDAEGWISKQLSSLDPDEMKRQVKSFTEFLGEKPGHTAEDERHAYVANALESLFTKAMGLPEGPRRASAEEKRGIESFSNTKIGKQLEEVKRKAIDENPERVVSTSTTTERTINQDGSVATRVEVWKQYAGGEKVEAICTTTEHTTSEDGSVETKVEIWKRYSDGRETTTTTSHTEEPSYCDNEDTFNHSEKEGTNQSILGKTVSEKKEEKKQGWFWN